MRCLSDANLREYLDRELSGPALSRADTHLAMCDSCRERLAVMESEEEAIGRALSRLDPQPLPAGVVGLPPLVLRQRPFRTRRLFQARIPLPLPLLAGMVALLLFLSGMVFFQQRAIARLSEKPKAAPRQLEMVIGNERAVKGINLDLDLSGYVPVRDLAVQIVEEKGS